MIVEVEVKPFCVSHFSDVAAGPDAHRSAADQFNCDISAELGSLRHVRHKQQQQPLCWLFSKRTRTTRLCKSTSTSWVRAEMARHESRPRKTVPIRSTQKSLKQMQKQRRWGGGRAVPEVSVEKQLQAASSAGFRASDWEQDSHRDREKCSAVTQAGLSRATRSRPSASKTHSRAMSLKGRNANTSFTDIFMPGSTQRRLAGGPSVRPCVRASVPRLRPPRPAAPN